MQYVIYTLYVIACVILIAVVLLQPGKGDVASALGGGTAGAALGPRGATTILAKITIAAAIAFMTIAFLFSVPGVLTPRSVTSGLEAAPAPAATEIPVTPGEGVPATPVPAPAPAGTAAPATPAGTIEVQPDGSMKTEAPGKAPAAAPATPPAAPAAEQPKK